MSIALYYGAGSAFTRRVWLALLHKNLPHELRPLSFAKGETRAPAFLAKNPRGRVPLVEFEGFMLYESAAILEWLDEQFPSSAPIFPGDSKNRAVIRRKVCEIDQYVSQALDQLWAAVLAPKKEDFDLARAHAARDASVRELAFCEAWLTGEWLHGDTLTAVDFTLYPMLALGLRCDVRESAVGYRAALAAAAPKLVAWHDRMHALEIVQKSIPDHWRG